MQHIYRRLFNSKTFGILNAASKQRQPFPYVIISKRQTDTENNTYKAVVWNVWPFHCQSYAVQHDANKYSVVERLPRDQSTAKLTQSTLAMSTERL